MWALTQQAELKCVDTDQGTESSGAVWEKSTYLRQLGPEALIWSSEQRAHPTWAFSELSVTDRRDCRYRVGLPSEGLGGSGTADLTCCSQPGQRLSPRPGRRHSRDLAPAGLGPEPSPLGRMASDSSSEPLRLRFSPENRG